MSSGFIRLNMFWFIVFQVYREQALTARSLYLLHLLYTQLDLIFVTVIFQHSIALWTVDAIASKHLT